MRKVLAAILTKIAFVIYLGVCVTGTLYWVNLIIAEKPPSYNERIAKLGDALKAMKETEEYLRNRVEKINRITALIDSLEAEQKSLDTLNTIRREQANALLEEYEKREAEDKILEGFIGYFISFLIGIVGSWVWYYIQSHLENKKANLAE